MKVRGMVKKQDRGARIEAPCSKLQGIFDPQGNSIYPNRSLTRQQAAVDAPAPGFRSQEKGSLLAGGSLWLRAPGYFPLRLRSTAGVARVASGASKYSSARKLNSEETTLLGKTWSAVR